MKLLELLQAAEQTLCAAQVEVPDRTARWLWQYVSGMSIGECFLRQTELVNPTDADAFLQLVERRARREPLQYLVGETEFCGLPFFVDHRVLIPRPETEQLVDLAVRAVEQQLARKNELTIVDVGTGSGAIIVALAVRLQESDALLRFYATDISSDALAVAKINAKRHRVDDRITFVEGTYVTGLPHDVKSIDILLSNPPYIPIGTKLQPEVAEWEPKIALYAQHDGLACYEELATLTKSVLAMDGSVAVEVGVGQADAVSQLWRAALPLASVQIVQDFRKIDRFVIVSPVEQ
ncbi:MAG: peptide chain release factor N(5)-glutamine methyltransferase [Acidibacillus sp.]|uniref:Release factor glutamine methyltransferase n=1 Tax=Sulfoacidibacillus ferrooxidans TaxID=2005001 RepID=A0A9X2ABR8_9BACL|nr:peptide chain release factor N(5)-glutamine methyltransferase [Sulfoacidibacillus ferrooxidans]MCI0183353.1 Release factor glutamine methyltransferase [Sulfoacidibacillus ferrooxidans]MCY0893969.1 peptide chain release factor N(5)-glutamine methyltransferase [Acidibacillus sp.]